MTGWRNTRRIIVADNVLRNYDYDKIEAVLAHESECHTRRHLGQGVARQAS